MTAAFDVLNSSRSALSLTAANAPGTAVLKNSRLPSSCSIAICVRICGGLSRFYLASASAAGIAFSRAISARSRSSGGANARLIMMYALLVSPLL